MYLNMSKRMRREGGESVHIALVESVREGKKLHQHHVAYLGAYRPDQLGDWERQVFWHDVGVRLDALDLKVEEREKIEARLARHVPRPGRSKQSSLYKRSRPHNPDNPIENAAPPTMNR